MTTTWTEADRDRIKGEIMDIVNGRPERRRGELQYLEGLLARIERALGGGNGPSGPGYWLAVTRSGLE